MDVYPVHNLELVQVNYEIQDCLMLRAPTRTRTWNPLIKSQLLYQLSHGCKCVICYPELEMMEPVELAAMQPEEGLIE